MSGLLVPSRRIVTPGDRADRGLWSPDGGLHPLRGRGRVLGPDGEVLWAEPWQLNALANEGEADMLNVYFLNSVAERANLYLALLTAAPSATTTMATMTELSGTGYARATVAAADWGALSGTQPTSTTAAQKAFGPNTSGGNWTALTHVAVVTTSSGTAGKFILYVALSSAVTIPNGISFDYQLTAQAT